MSLGRIHKVDCKDPKWEELFHKVLNRLTEVEPNIQVKVFGSFVSNRMTAASDIDIAVIIPDTWRTKDFLDRLYSKGPLANWPIDLVVLRLSQYNKKKEIGGVSFDIYHEGIDLFPEWKLK